MRDTKSGETVVREASEPDLAALSGLEARCFGDHGYNYLTLRQLLDVFPDLFLVFEVEGTPAGYCLGAIGSPAAGSWVLSIAVAEGFRGRGIGSVLLAGLIERLRSRGANRIRGTVSRNNVAMLDVCRRCGGVLGPHIPDYFGPGEGRYVIDFVAPGML